MKRRFEGNVKRLNKDTLISTQLFLPNLFSNPSISLAWFFISRSLSFVTDFLRNRVNNSQRNNQLKYNTSRSSIELWINNSAKDWLANYHIGNPSSKPVVRYTEPWRELGQGCQSMARTSPSATNVYVLDRQFAATSKTTLLGSATPRTSNF